MRRAMAGKGKAGLDEAGLDDLLKWAERVQTGEPEPEPEVMGSPPPATSSSSLPAATTPAGVAMAGSAAAGATDSPSQGGAQAEALGQPPAGFGSMPAISRLPPKPPPEPGSLDSLGRPLSAIERGIITPTEAAPEKVELPKAIGKSWWTDDSVVTRCEMAGCAQTFGKRTRRHHCRKCGKCVCKDCSTYKLMLQHPEEKTASKQVSHDRVCGACYIEFKQFASPTLGQGGVRLSESASGGAAGAGGEAAGSGSGQGAAAGSNGSSTGKLASEIDWSDVAEEDPQIAARMLRSGRPY
jgi:hypothetical protein